MRLVYVALLACSVFAAGCNSDNSTSSSSKETNINKTEKAGMPQSKLNDAGTQILIAELNKYYDLKNALVATNAGKADEAAKQLLTVNDSLAAFTQKDSTNAGIKPYLDTISNQSKSILGMMDESCEHKRVFFEKISDNMYALAKALNLKNAGIYQQYCPMAFNEKGAHWLSNESEIKNPYFGKKMLECGDVTDSLK